MALDIQIHSLIFSFIFGCIFYVLLDIFNKWCCKVKLVFKIVLSLLFVLILAGLYFMMLLRINNGYLHVYFFISILVGYIMVYFIKSNWFTHFKK